ncbi:Anti-sigma factor N-terminus [Carboxydocella sporoproducens DSM 16521]|uniref:Anti-sigma factor N-terminus n=2 Tax=Carboxydocella TaxID=178898 RepID=A0A1T4PHT7_9FIRM|nr:MULTISPECIES: anti-sigma factor domain-containing protein [Carboxydocella]AVX21473.1 Anti-sigma factor N-terminus [Carboxydocella thermautotrophica]SJZ90877.1 Anti-sigma factor N-terminus [Carboxydocella sporoproducens DSM 16521]
MKKNKGVVLEIEGKQAIVLGPGGEFRTIRLHKPVEIGEEIELGPEKVAVFTSWRHWLGAVAAVFLVLALLPFWQQWNQPNLGPVVTYLSLDINPSFQLGLDDQNRVVEEQGLNQEAKELLASTPIHGLAAAEAVNRLTRAAEAAGYLGKNGSPQIILAVASRQGEAKAAQVAALLRQQTKQFLERQQLQVALKTVVTVPQAVQIAAGQGLSLGKLVQNIEEKKNRQEQETVKPATTAVAKGEKQQTVKSEARVQTETKSVSRNSTKQQGQSTKEQKPAVTVKPATTNSGKPQTSQPAPANPTKPAVAQPEDQGIVFITEIDLSLGGEGGTATPSTSGETQTQQQKTDNN